MARVNEAWLVHQRKRWVRADAHRWFAPNYKNFAPPQQKAGFDPDQPRDELGQWTETGADEEGDGTESVAEVAPLDELSSADRPRGDHFVARYAYRNLPLQPETKKVFDQATTGPLSAGPHRYSVEHRAYNEAIKESLTRFMDENGVTPQTMSPEQAQRFVDSVKRSAEPRIRNYNLGIYRREINYLIRRLGRRPE